MNGKFAINRRDFLKVSYAAGAGLLVSIYLPGCAGKPGPASTPTAAATPRPPLAGPDKVSPSVFVTLGQDGTVAITIHRSEMGQGVRTALAMILAEDLDADWKSIRVRQADGDSAYGDQQTGGSVSISGSYLALRMAGALARSLILSAAAQFWSIAKEDLTTENGTVVHPQTGEKLPYGYLVPLAAGLPMPSRSEVKLKPAQEFRFIGTRVGSLDNADFVTGKAIYGADVTLPGMLYAVVVHNPEIYGKITGYDEGQARQVPGVRDIVKLGDGVAVVAENTWSALQGRQALSVTFGKGLNAGYSSAAEEQELMKEAAVEAGPDELVAYYVMPYLSHAPMEPMNCVADAKPDRCDVWVSSQDPMSFKYIAMGAAGTDVSLHVPLLGGGFGRRLGVGPVNYVGEAVEISKAVGAPVKLFWTREEDIQHEYYHPLSVTAVKANLGDIASLQASRFEASGVPTGAWRSVTNVPEAFARECFIDEFAHATGQDPVELHRKTVYGRGLGVVDLAAEKAGWGTPPPAGRARGFAYHATWGVTHVAQVAEVSVDGQGGVRVHRVVCAVDCGTVINPDTVEAQMEGGIVFGLTAALKASVSFENGRVQQTNFHDYPLLRMDEAPVVEVYIVPSTETPTGIGEMSNPVIMPAVANAIFAATGKRLRRLPIRPADILAA